MACKMELEESNANNDDEEQDLSKLIFQRTKSISISGGDTKSASKGKAANKIEPGAFSLSDLANEYLSTSNTTNPNSDFSSTNNLIVDLIDHEFSKNLNLGNTDESTENQMVDLGKQNIFLINKQPKDKQSILSNKLSTSYELASSISSSLGLSSSLTNLSPSKNVQLISPPPVEDVTEDLKIENEKSLFILEKDSLVGRFLTEADINALATESGLFKKFDYASQMKFTRKRRKLMAKFRKRLRIEPNEPLKIVSTLSEGVANRENKPSGKKGSRPGHQSSSSSSSKAAAHKTKKKQQPAEETVKIFDFSIPSPDDLILAKQKFAFKNLRFK